MRALGTFRCPRGFLGAATAAYQIEGATDGRRPRRVDLGPLRRTPGQVANGDTGDLRLRPLPPLARRPRPDARRSASARYRFSIAWPRIQPDGRGPVNQAGLDFYRRLVDGLLERGHHAARHALPLGPAAGARGRRRLGHRATPPSASPSTRGSCFDGLGDVVHDWITHNEPWCTSFLGYGLRRQGARAPRPARGARAPRTTAALARPGRRRRSARRRRRAGSASRSTCAGRAGDRPPRTSPPRGASTASTTAGSSTRSCAAAIPRTWSTLYERRFGAARRRAATATSTDRAARSTSSASTTTGRPASRPTRRATAARSARGRASAAAHGDGLADRPGGADRAARAPAARLRRRCRLITENGAAFDDRRRRRRRRRRPASASPILDEHLDGRRRARSPRASTCAATSSGRCSTTSSGSTATRKRFGIVYVDYATQRARPEAQRALVPRPDRRRARNGGGA